MIEWMDIRDVCKMRLTQEQVVFERDLKEW
jgi:hypothetical protein